MPVSFVKKGSRAYLLPKRSIGWTKALPNAADIRNEMTLFVIDSKGRLTQFSTLPRDNAGNFIANDVRAIYRPNAHFQTHETMSGPLHPNQSSMIDIQTVSVPVHTRPRAFASALIMDSREVIPEPNERNNGHAECEVVFGLHPQACATLLRAR